jgi:hypothetical protein
MLLKFNGTHQLLANANYVTILGDNMGTKQTPWPLVRKRTTPTERSPLVDEI